MKSLSIPISQTLPSVTPQIVGRHVPGVPSIGFRTSHKLLLFLRSSGLLSFFPKGSVLGFAIAEGGLRGPAEYLIDLSYDVFVRSESILDGEVVGIVPVEGAFRLVVAISVTACAVGESVSDVRHSGVRGVVLYPAELEAGNEKVATVAIPQIVEDGGVA